MLVFHLVRRQHPESQGSGSRSNYTHADSLTDSTEEESMVSVLYQLPCWWDWLTHWSSGGPAISRICSHSTGGLINGRSHDLDQLAQGFLFLLLLSRLGLNFIHLLVLVILSHLKVSKPDSWAKIRWRVHFRFPSIIILKDKIRPIYIYIFFYIYIFSL